MSEEKFTPGPWTVIKANWDESIYVVGSDTVCLFQYLREDDHCTIHLDNDEANAQFISVAPEMYKVIKTIIEPYEGMSDEMLDEIAPDWLYEAREILKKARGEK